MNMNILAISEFSYDDNILWFSNELKIITNDW